MIEQDNEKLTFAIKKNNELIEELVYELEQTKDELRELKDNINDLKYDMGQIIPEDIAGRVDRLIRHYANVAWWGIIVFIIMYFIAKDVFPLIS